MKTKLIVMLSILILPLSVSFADFKQPDTMIINNDGSTTIEPMDDGMNQPIKNTRKHLHKKKHYRQEHMKQFDQDVPQKMPNNAPLKTTPNDVPLKKIPNDVPVKQPSDFN
jgi:hypothetical protein